jgi:Putative motility protein
MDATVSSISSLATQMSNKRTTDAVDTLMLKKTLDIQQGSALQLIAAATPARALPSHIGQNVNTVA